MTVTVRHLTTLELEAGLEEIQRSPRDAGVLEMIVRRRAVGERELLQEGQLDPVDGLVGDNWRSRLGDNPDPYVQLTLMNARVAALVAQDRSRWPLAGDQLYVDLDLSDDNLPPGTRLTIGSATLEISAQPHTGCSKFVERFGVEALKFVNGVDHKSMHMRGIYARVVQPGVIRVGDTLTKI